MRSSLGQRHALPGLHVGVLVGEQRRRARARRRATRPARRGPRAARRHRCRARAAPTGRRRARGAPAPPRRRPPRGLRATRPTGTAPGTGPRSSPARRGARARSRAAGPPRSRRAAGGVRFLPRQSPSSGRPAAGSRYAANGSSAAAPAMSACTRKCSGSSGFCQRSRALACANRYAVYTAVSPASTTPGTARACGSAGHPARAPRRCSASTTAYAAMMNAPRTSQLRHWGRVKIR